jgi:hypothetical protein
MDSHSEKKTIVNVKGVSLATWEAAKKAANLSGETMGAWLNRWIAHAVEQEAGGRIFPPLPADNPGQSKGNPGTGYPVAHLGNPSLAVAFLKELAPVAAALGEKLSRQAAIDVSAAVSLFAREAQGKPPRNRKRQSVPPHEGLGKERVGGLADGLESPDSGQAISRNETFEESVVVA